MQSPENSKIEDVVTLAPEGWKPWPLRDDETKLALTKTYNFEIPGRETAFKSIILDYIDKKLPKDQHHADVRALLNKVEVNTYTPDAGTITNKDTELAAEIDRLYNSFNEI